MKCKFTFLLACLIATSYSFAQVEKGLEGIIVEKYYVSDANDAMNTAGGTVPVGSTTYRVYVDMKPGYKFLAAFGDVNHELKIASTTKFFNNEDRGDVHPVFNKNALKANTVMLDSWLTAGGACLGNLGVLKSKDNGSATVVNADGILANKDPKAGIPLTEQDGMVLGKVLPAQSAGFNNDLEIFNNINEFSNGVALKSNSGAWFTPEGASGADSLDNMVLIAQLTTDGVLTFDLNIQLKTPTAGVTQTFVAKDPTTTEFFEPSLSYNSSAVGTKDVNTNQYFTVYPNPAQNDIYFKLDALKSDAPFHIYDATGKSVMHGVLDLGLQRLNISDLNGGIYIMAIDDNGSKLYSRIVKL